MTTATQEKISRPSIPHSQLERLAVLMGREGITGKPAELLEALLDRFEEGREDSAKTAHEVTSAVSWFASQIDSLQAQLSEVTRERDSLRQQVSKSAKPATATATATATETNSEPPQVRSRSRSKGESTQKIQQCLDALLCWNAQQESSNTRLRISVPVLKSLGRLIGCSYQPAIRTAITERVADIDEQHSEYMLGSRHNRSIAAAEKDRILQEIARDYMRVDNWQEASFS